jgi:hypothetical protein
MQLRNARLCLDCDEIHDGLQCPVCASETFTYIARWVPMPEPRSSRPSNSAEADVYRRLVNVEESPRRGRRMLKQGAVALTALGVLGWLWQARTRRDESDV